MHELSIAISWFIWFLPYGQEHLLSVTGPIKGQTVCELSFSVFLVLYAGLWQGQAVCVVTVFLSVGILFCIFELRLMTLFGQYTN